MDEFDPRDRLIDILLKEELGGQKPVDVSKRVLETLRQGDFEKSESLLSNKNFTSFTKAWVSLAACLLIVVSVYVTMIWQANPSTKLIQARVTETTEGTRIFREQKWTPLKVGMELQEQDSIDTGSEGHLRVSYTQEDTTIHLLKNTLLVFLNSERGKNLQLKQGRIECKVASQPIGRHMEVLTQQAKIEILGTTLSIEAQDNTRLDVLEGLVQITRLSDSAQLQVGKGEYAITSSSKGAEPKPFELKELADEFHEVSFDPFSLHALAVEESLKPVRPGIPGQKIFWNSRATSFIYAPVFDFKPVKGALSYRFTATSYTNPWVFDSNRPRSSLQTVWQDLPKGRISTRLSYMNAQGVWERSRQATRWSEKKNSDTVAPIMDFHEEQNAQEYRFFSSLVTTFTFEADRPWASLTPIWKDIPDGLVNLSVEGLDKKGGKKIALAKIGKTTVRQFERRVAFAGPYHEAAMDYTEAGARWLRWVVSRRYYKWKKEGNPNRLGQYPCKDETSAITAMITLSSLETDPLKKKEALQMAQNAARTLIKGGFPRDWALAGLPPTFGFPQKYGSVVMTHPAYTGTVYLDLYEVTREKEFLEAAIIIADVYRKTQLSDGSWPILMDAKSGQKEKSSRTYINPTHSISLFYRLTQEHHLKIYQPSLQSAVTWAQNYILKGFHFEGQSENAVASRGGHPWHISSGSACRTMKTLLGNQQGVPANIPLAEEIMRWSEDQFIFWELPRSSDKLRFTPRTIDQHNGPLWLSAKSNSSAAATSISAYQKLYEATGKNIYLAKAVTFANAMTLLQKRKYGGNYVSTDWGWGDSPGGWINCHTYSAKVLIEFGQMLKDHHLYVPVNPDSGKDLPFFNKK